MIAIGAIAFMVLFIPLSLDLFSWDECNEIGDGKHCFHYHESDGPPKIIHCPVLVFLTSDLPLNNEDIGKRVMASSRAIANLIIQWDQMNEYARILNDKMENINKLTKNLNTCPRCGFESCSCMNKER